MASKNRGKTAEIRAIFEGLGIDLPSLEDYPGSPEVVEDGASFFENALKKAKAVSLHTGEWALADDSGLVVKALDGGPGILSARYAGTGATDEKNNRKLLDELAGIPETGREAYFQCVVVLCSPEGKCRSFEGRLNGRIARQCSGTHGFGYDPVFFVPEFGSTVAELPPEIKNRISHRSKALEQLKKSLQNGLER
ncbi:MAG: XTP/dITP diphosphatase [Syntrophales bacterium]|nr:XTP/dITP diphosphatase [Syntrophales bacterium]